MASKARLILKLLVTQWEEADLGETLFVFAIQKRLMRGKRRHRFWVHNNIEKMKKICAFYHLVKCLVSSANRDDNASCGPNDKQ